MADGYVTNWGNDANDGLTWETSKRTFQGAKDSLLSPVYAKGYFNEMPISNTSVIGVGYFVLESFAITGNISMDSLSNAVVKGYGSNYFSRRSNSFNGSHFINNTRVANNHSSKKVVFQNVETLNIVYGISESITAHKCLNVDITLGNQLTQNNFILSNIDELSFVRDTSQFASYSLIINSKIRFYDDGDGEVAYTYPVGATDEEKLQNLRDRAVAVYGGLASDYLVGCKYYSGSYNDIFQDADNGNFYLKEGCIAANMAYDGGYVGAKPVGANLDLSQFTLTNIDSNGKVINQEVDSTMLSNIIDLAKVRKILEWKNIGSIAARNGQQINTVENLSAAINPGTNVLTDTKVYMCIDDVITLDDAAGTSYNPWETFVATDEGSGAGLGFSTSGVGKVQEVLTDLYDQKIKVKSSKTDSGLTTATQLQYYLHQQPKCNIDANGEPTYGNADALFNEATAVDLYTRYIQFDITIQANVLPAR